jgi:hypothetical protein
MAHNQSFTMMNVAVSRKFHHPPRQQAQLPTGAL